MVIHTKIQRISIEATAHQDWSHKKWIQWGPHISGEIILRNCIENPKSVSSMIGSELLEIHNMVHSAGLPYWLQSLTVINRSVRNNYTGSDWVQWHLNIRWWVLELPISNVKALCYINANLFCCRLSWGIQDHSYFLFTNTVQSLKHSYSIIFSPNALSAVGYYNNNNIEFECGIKVVPVSTICFYCSVSRQE